LWKARLVPCTLYLYVVDRHKMNTTCRYDGCSSCFLQPAPATAKGREEFEYLYRFSKPTHGAV
jgi:hypothetical protein